jgi:hypothetical protein
MLAIISKVPALPMDRIMEYFLEDEYKTGPSPYGDRKTPTKRQIYLYNETTKVANAALMMTACFAAMSVARFFNTAFVPATVLPFWVHISAKRYCAGLLAENSEPDSSSLFGLDPLLIKNWKRESFEWKGIFSWLQCLPPVSQDELDALPTSIREYVLISPSSPGPGLSVHQQQNLMAGIIQRTEQIWLGVHERNRAALRKFFDDKSRHLLPNERQLALANIFRTHLANPSCQAFFAEARSQTKITQFLNSRG